MEHSLTLDEQLCFALYSATNSVTRSYRPLLKDIGLTYPQYLAMLVLWQDGSCPSGHIAVRLGLSPNAITPLLDRLEKSGLIRRRRDLKDRRVVHVDLTDKGTDLKAGAYEAHRQVVCHTGLTPEQLVALREDLKALVARMEASPSEPEVAENDPSARAVA